MSDGQDGQDIFQPAHSIRRTPARPPEDRIPPAQDPTTAPTEGPGLITGLFSRVLGTGSRSAANQRAFEERAGTSGTDQNVPDPNMEESAADFSQRWDDDVQGLNAPPTPGHLGLPTAPGPPTELDVCAQCNRSNLAAQKSVFCGQCSSYFHKGCCGKDRRTAPEWPQGPWMCTDCRLQYVSGRVTHLCDLMRQQTTANSQALSLVIPAVSDVAKRLANGEEVSPEELEDARRLVAAVQPGQEDQAVTMVTTEIQCNLGNDGDRAVRPEVLDDPNQVVDMTPAQHLLKQYRTQAEAAKTLRSKAESKWLALTEENKKLKDALEEAGQKVLAAQQRGSLTERKLLLELEAVEKKAVVAMQQADAGQKKLREQEAFLDDILKEHSALVAKLDEKAEEIDHLQRQNVSLRDLLEAEGKAAGKHPDTHVSAPVKVATGYESQFQAQRQAAAKHLYGTETASHGGQASRQSAADLKKETMPGGLLYVDGAPPVGAEPVEEFVDAEDGISPVAKSRPSGLAYLKTLPKLRPFRLGKGELFESFERSVSMRMKHLRLSDAEKCQFLKDHTDGEVRDRIDRLLVIHEQDGISYDELVQSLNRTFNFVKTPLEARQEFFERRWKGPLKDDGKKGETPQAFMSDLERLYLLAWPLHPAETRFLGIMDQFIQGFNDKVVALHLQSIRTRGTGDASTMEELVTAATDYMRTYLKVGQREKETRKETNQQTTSTQTPPGGGRGRNRANFRDRADNRRDGRARGGYQRYRYQWDQTAVDKEAVEKAAAEAAAKAKAEEDAKATAGDQMKKDDTKSGETTQQRPPIICHNCRKPGHTVARCWAPGGGEYDPKRWPRFRGHVNEVTVDSDNSRDDISEIDCQPSTRASSESEESSSEEAACVFIRGYPRDRDGPARGCKSHFQ